MGHASESTDQASPSQGAQSSPRSDRVEPGDAAGAAATVEIPRANVRWSRSATGSPLGRTQRRLLRRELGVTHLPGPDRRVLEPVRVAGSRLDARTVTALRQAVGGGQVSTDATDRLARAGGMSYPDLIRRSEEPVLDVPDAVVRPGTHDEVMAVLRVCEEHHVAVVPYGGGTSVVGGVDPAAGRPGLTVGLDRLAAFVELDATSQTATLQPGLTGPEAERLLAERGYTLGHFPQSWERSTVGGWVATRSAGQLSTGVGQVADLVVALRVATPRGTLRLGRGPRSAAGPDLRELFVGSEGAFGIVTEATLRVRPVPTVKRYLGWSFADLGSGLAACRALRQAGVAPDVLRLSDPEETRVTLRLAGGAGAPFRAYQKLRNHRGGCLLITGWEGTSETIVRSRRQHAAAVIKQAGGVPLGAQIGAAWEHGRYAAPYLRDTLLDAGLLAETLETAASWSTLPELHDAVTRALRRVLTDLGTPPMVMAHVSHAYPTGASLYVTVIARRGEMRAAEQWWAAKRAATDAITELGATITHHHAVGTEHLPWLEDEIGPLGVEVLKAVKRTVDPAGILNPGTLVPED